MKNTTTILKIGKKFFLENIVNTIFLLLTIILFTFSKQFDNSSPEIIFFDIGQGDAILIQQDNFQILVDGGPDDGIVYELAKQLPWYDKNIEIVVLTHPHDDHIRGLLNVLDQYSVEKIFMNRIEYENRAYEYLLTNYQEKIVEVEQGDVFEYKNIYGEILYPFAEKAYQEKNINNESVVILLEMDNYRTLLMGDAEQEVENKLIEKYNLEDIYLLKVGHHCSRTSTSDMFLSETNPDIAICSCGEDNKFGHPHYETLEKFQTRDVQYLITYQEGNIVINFDNL
jgi:competence protein ComEC